MDDECVHGMNPDWCGTCKKVPEVGSERTGSYGFHGGETKQEVLHDICDLLRIPHQATSNGSSLPSDVFAEAAHQTGVTNGSMPEVAEAIIRKAGMTWSPAFDSRSTASGGGSTVTLEGIQALRSALRALGLTAIRS